MTQLYTLLEAMKNESPEKVKTFALSWTHPPKPDKQRVIFKANELTKSEKIVELITELSKKFQIPAEEISFSFRRIA